MNKDKIEANKAAGLCTRCDNPVAPGKKMCQPHLDKEAEKSRKRRARLKANQTCDRCGQKPAEQGKSKCQTCLDGHRKYDHKKVEQYYDAKANGLCVRCKNNPASNSLVHCETCQEYMARKDKAYYHALKENECCVACREPNDNGKVLCDECAVLNSNNNKKLRDKQKDQVINHYGGICSCCNESHIDFLAIDHIDGGGTKHRKQLRKQGTTVYRWILKNDFPENMFQVLCHNCNLGRHINGGICPHQEHENKL